MNDFDALCASAYDPHTGEPSGRDALNALWTALYQLPSWWVGLDPQHRPYTEQDHEGVPWLCVFTDPQRLDAYRTGPDQAGGGVQELSADSRHAWLAERARQVQAAGVRFNPGPWGWFAPLERLKPIEDHLHKAGLLVSRDLLTKLRTELYSAPSLEGWTRMVAQLDSAQGELLAVALTYTERLLDQSWPDAMRPLAYHWGLSHLEQTPMSQAALARCFHLPTWVQGWLAHHNQPLRVLSEPEGWAMVDELEVLAGHPLMEQIRVLDLTLPGSASYGELPWSPRLTHVHALKMDIRTTDALQMLVDAAPYLGQLETVELRAMDHRVTMASSILLELFDALPKQGIRTLSLSALLVTPDTARQISARLGDLELLRLRSSYPIPTALSALLQPQLFTHLRTLDLTHNNLTPDQLTQLLAVWSPPGLETLLLGHNRIDREGVQNLARHPAMAAVRHLSLRNNPIDDEGLQALARSRYLDSLQSINVRETRVTLGGVRALLESERLPKLKRLTVLHNNLPMATVRTLAAERGLEPEALDDARAT
ncbi:MAG: hypothetical protein AAFX99_20975 [Myxococcota bacterium]